MKRDESYILESDLQKLSELIEFVCATQTAVWNDACRLLCKETHFGVFSEAIDTVKAMMNAWVCALKGKRYADLHANTSSQPQEEIVRQLAELKKIKTLFEAQPNKQTLYDRPDVLLSDIKKHLQQLHAALAMRAENQKARLEALFDRNLLNLQWALESSYRCLGVTHGIRRLKNHDFTVFQTYLSAAICEISEVEVVDVAPFNLREMLYYPRYVKYTRGNLSGFIIELLKKLEQSKKCSVHGEDPQRTQNGASLDKAFQNALTVLGTHLEQIRHRRNIACCPTLGQVV
jgi:hypothetical protein